jgi:phosphatidylglycerophosphatase C
MTAEARHDPASDAPIAAFDFDGTLTCRDSFIAFLRWRAGPPGFLAGLPALTGEALAYLIYRDRGALKTAAARRFLGPIAREELRGAAARFCEEQFASLMRPDALACWNAWGGRGARRVIVTASPEDLVAPFARRLGAQDLIGTRLAWDAEGRFAGRLDGPNCRGGEKVARLREALGPDVRLAAAYGDTAGDAQMLAIAAERGYRVFRGRP